MLDEIRNAGRRAANVWLEQGPPVDHLEDTAGAEVIDLPAYRRASMAALHW